MPSALSMYERFINLIYSSKVISISEDFQTRCTDINRMLDNDVTGLVSTLLGYMINSASEAKLKVECSNETLENLLDSWLQQINIYIDNVPTGLQELAKEYYRERWQGSSLCLLKISDWKEINIGNSSITVPTTLWFFNGASIYIKRPKEFKLGSDNYFSDEALKNAIINNDKEQFIVQKPGTRWTVQYPSPYCVRKGILKNYKALEVLQSKGDEVIAKVLPYILQQIKGTEAAFLQKGLKFTDTELKAFQDTVKLALKRYKNQGAEVPLATTPFDEEFKHIIPEILPMIKEELFRQGTRNLLAGLGFIDMLEIAPSRQETRLNPKPFIAEINDGVDGFKSLLKEVIYLIIKRNKEYHKKFFSDNTTLTIANTPIRVNVEQIMDYLNRGFIYGGLSYETYHEILGVDHSREIERMKKEWEKDLRSLFYPHIIQNQEDKGIDTNISAPPITKKQIEKKNEKNNAEITNEGFIKDQQVILNPGKYAIAIELANEKTWVRNGFCEWNTEEKGYIFDEKFNVARVGLDGYVFVSKKDLKENLIAKCKKCGHEFNYLSVQEAGMGYVKCPKCQEAVTQDDVIIASYDKNNPPAFLKKYPKEARDAFIDTFNKLIKDGKPESYAFPIAWNVLKRVMKKLKEKK